MLSEAALARWLIGSSDGARSRELNVHLVLHTHLFSSQCNLLLSAAPSRYTYITKGLVASRKKQRHLLAAKRPSGLETKYTLYAKYRECA